MVRALIVGALSLQGVAVAHAAPSLRRSCTLTKQDIIEYDRDAKTTREIEDWTVHCVCREGDKVVVEKTLVLGHPTSYEDAMVATRVWMKEGK